MRSVAITLENSRAVLIIRENGHSAVFTGTSVPGFAEVQRSSDSAFLLSIPDDAVVFNPADFCTFRHFAVQTNCQFLPPVAVRAELNRIAYKPIIWA